MMQMFFICTGYRLIKAEGNFRIGAGIKYKIISDRLQFQQFWGIRESE